MRTTVHLVPLVIVSVALSECRTLDVWQVRSAVVKHLEKVIAKSANDRLTRPGQYVYGQTSEGDKPTPRGPQRRPHRLRHYHRTGRRVEG